MSASLVGSEMCIRDSAEGGGAPTPDMDGHGPPRPASGRGPSVLGGGALCLLYTSDAADDM
eukprot:1575359-Alexandrium_andersonii.AAC.1